MIELKIRLRGELYLYFNNKYLNEGEVSYPHVDSSSFGGRKTRSEEQYWAAQIRLFAFYNICEVSITLVIFELGKQEIIVFT